jgi:hypothetical protein
MTHRDDTRAHLAGLFAASDDPWHFKSRWYEARKRALTLACLPRARYASGFEPGCANGELSASLAERCDRLLISDGTEAAVRLARRRVAALPQVSVMQGWIPDQWPDERFDLIVVSELIYFLDTSLLETLAAKIRASLADGGDLVACHWRHPVEDCPLDADALHEALSRSLGLPRVWSLVDPDFRLEVWSSDERSIAVREAVLAPRVSGRQ